MARKSKAEKKYTAEEIVKLVDEKRNSEAMTQLRAQMDTDFALYTLQGDSVEEGHQSYTSSKPLSHFDKVFTGLNKAHLTWRIVVPEDASEEDRASASKGEAILTGFLDRTDRQLRNIQEPPLRQGVGWYICARGLVVGKCLLYTNEDKEMEQDIRAMDPLHCTWERGSEGLVWAALEYHIEKAEAKERYKIEVEGDNDTVRVIDFFDTELNAVVLVYGSVNSSTKEFAKPPTVHDLDHVPIYVGFVGGMPTVYDSSNKPTLKHRAASVYHSSRTLYKPFNKQVSFIMDVAEKSVAGTLKYVTEDGRKQVIGDPFGSWKVIPLKIGESLEALEPPKVPPETAAILGIIDRDMQQSTVPSPIGYGEDPQGHSGSALSILNDNMRSIFDPFAAQVEDFYHWLCEEILKQFKQKGQKLQLKGFGNNGQFFTMEADRSDIQDAWYIQVKCEPRMPRDEAAELQMALAGTQPRPPFMRPLLSDFTAREKILKLQNPDAEDKRIAEQQISRQIEQMPNIQIRRVAEQLAKSGDLMGAQELLASIPAPGMGGGGPQQPGQGQAGPPPPQQGMPPQGGMPGGRIDPQDAQIAMKMAEDLARRGQPIPPELQAVLARIPAPQGGP